MTRVAFLLCLLATVSWGQTAPTIEVVDKLPSGYVLKIDGKNYLAVDGDKAKELLTYKLQNDSLRSQLEKVSQTFSEFKATSEKLLSSEQEKFQLELTKSREETKFYRKQYEEEKVLRETFEKDLRRCGRPWLFGYRLCKF